MSPFFFSLHLGFKSPSERAWSFGPRSGNETRTQLEFARRSRRTRRDRHVTRIRLTEPDNMHRMPPPTESLSRNFCDETIVWIRADENERDTERRAQWTHNDPETCYDPSSNIPTSSLDWLRRPGKLLTTVGRCSWMAPKVQLDERWR
jgi:hypothetical protein